VSYQILLTDGTVFATIQDGTINNSSSVTLVGKNYAGYGAFLDSNFIHLLENGSNTIPPINPLVGQLWWDQSNGILQVFNGIDFKSLGGATASPTPPTNNIVGDLWYDTINQELNVYTGTEYIVVGPNISNGTGTKSTTIVDNVSITHYVVEILVENNIVAIVSKDAPFVPGVNIPGFVQVFPGITIADSVANVDQFFNGTSTNTLALEGHGINDFILTTGGSIDGSLTISNGLSVGPANELNIGTAGSNVSITNTGLNGNITFIVNDNTVLTNAVSIIGSSGNLVAGNVVAADFYGDGGHLSNINISNVAGAYSNANVAAYLPFNSANVNAGYFYGDGRYLSNLNAGNITSSYSNANVAAYLPVYSGDIAGDNVTFTGTAVINSQTLTSGTISTPPGGPTDIANKAYVDSVAQGLDPKDACFCVATANIALSGLQTIDSYTLLNTNRVLVVGQTASEENGIYNAAAGPWTRAADMTIWAECPGAYTLVTQGTQYQGTGWVCIAPAIGTINVTPMPWVQFHAAGTNSYTAGYGLSLTGTQFSIAPTYASAPPAWGTVTPNTGDFTSVVATGNVTTASYFVGNGSQLTDILGIVAGTRIVFAQATAPIGWAQVTDTSAAGRMLQVVNDNTGGQFAGTNSPILMNVVPSHTHTVNIASGTESVDHYHGVSGTTGTESVSHTHSINAGASSFEAAGFSPGTNVARYNAAAQSGAQSQSHVHGFSVNSGTESATHYHGVNGTTDGNAGAANWTPLYLNVIVCQKT
jgi:hypothetical protein